jgi:ring-1,2-phenylacetyl-CoA epoxidase subunit PaaC
VTVASEYLTLHLADNALILGQRNAEWAGHGPALEEDIALANMSLDLIGQARLLYQHAASLLGEDATEDRLAYFRDAHEFRNFTLCELPHSGPTVGYRAPEPDYAVTIVRNFLMSSYMLLLWPVLEKAQDTQLAAIAAKSFKETKYHWRHSRDWLLRLGDGTAESHARSQAALDYLYSFTAEFFTNTDIKNAVVAVCIDFDAIKLKADWIALTDAAFAEATLLRPSAAGFVPSGAAGVHSEHLSFLLAELQSVARAHPGAAW